MEAGTHSIWISEQLQQLGHEVIVANVRELRAISHRTVEQQEALTLIRARDLMVRLRTAEVNAVTLMSCLCASSVPIGVREESRCCHFCFGLEDQSRLAVISCYKSIDPSLGQLTTSSFFMVPIWAGGGLKPVCVHPFLLPSMRNSVAAAKPRDGAGRLATDELRFKNDGIWECIIGFL